MTAREIFEELGYKQVRNDSCLIKYEKFINGNCIQIIFTLLLKKVIATYGYQTSGSYAHDITLDEFRAIVQQEKELGWLEEEKQEIKQETNYEHFKDEIIENSGYCFALVDGKPCQCSDVSCSECGFSTGYGCSEKIKEWLNKPYEKPKYKLSQFEYDLLSVHKDYKTYNNIANQIHLFKMREKGYFKDVDTNVPIREILDNCEVIKR